MLHQDWMRFAIKEAEQAFNLGEIPVGAVVVHNGEIIAAAFNEKEKLQDPTAHAEVLAIQRAAAVLGTWRLAETTLYVTLEPCPMCAGAILQARIPRLIYGATDRKGGAVESVMNVLDIRCWNHRVEVIAGILEDECMELLKRFFTRLR